MDGAVDRWWEKLDPAPVVDEWMARQVIAFHARGDVPCATCSTGLVCERLAQARAMVGGDGSTTDAGAAPAASPTVRR